MDGLHGEPGRDGQRGEAGRDATQIEVIDAIDVDRAYPRGTYLRHAGGMVRSFRQTEPGEVAEERGWHVVMNGVAELDIEQGEDPRAIGIALRMTSGEVVLKTFRLPIPIDQGPYKAGRTYHPGDWATWDGLIWRALVETSGEPGVSKDWSIAIRKGRDGKDGKNGDRGERGEKGLQGNPGRDRG